MVRVPPLSQPAVYSEHIEARDTILASSDKTQSDDPAASQNSLTKAGMMLASLRIQRRSPYLGPPGWERPTGQAPGSRSGGNDGAGGGDFATPAAPLLLLLLLLLTNLMFHLVRADLCLVVKGRRQAGTSRTLLSRARTMAINAVEGEMVREELDGKGAVSVEVWIRCLSMIFRG